MLKSKVNFHVDMPGDVIIIIMSLKYQGLHRPFKSGRAKTSGQDKNF